MLLFCLLTSALCGTELKMKKFVYLIQDFVKEWNNRQQIDLSDYILRE